jgi:hypothetical protein
MDHVADAVAGAARTRPRARESVRMPMKLWRQR